MSEDPSEVRFGARRATKKKPDTYGRDTTDAFPSSTTEELLSSSQMKPDGQPYTTKPKAPRPSDPSSSNTAPSAPTGSEKKQNFWTQLKFKGGEEQK